MSDYDTMAALTGAIRRVMDGAWKEGMSAIELHDATLLPRVVMGAKAKSVAREPFMPVRIVRFTAAQIINELARRLADAEKANTALEACVEEQRGSIRYLTRSREEIAKDERLAEDRRAAALWNMTMGRT